MKLALANEDQAGGRSDGSSNNFKTDRLAMPQKHNSIVVLFAIFGLGCVENVLSAFLDAFSGPGKEQSGGLGLSGCRAVGKSGSREAQR